MLYSIPYIILLILLIVLYNKENHNLFDKNKKAVQNTAFILLLIFIGLRGFVLTDFYNYYPWFINLDKIYSLDVSEYTAESGFVVYSSLIKTVFPNYHIWVFINSLIDLLILKFTFKKYSHSEILSYIVYLAFSGIVIEFNLYRNVKAILLFMLSIPYLLNKRLLPYMLINLIGVSFHTSALLYLPLYFILNIRLPRWLRWGFIFMMVILYIKKVDLLGNIDYILMFIDSESTAVDKVANYMQSGDSYGFSFGFFERLISLILFTYFYDSLVKQRESNNIFYNLYLLYYATFQFFINNSILVNRIPLLFVISYAILYPNLIEINKKYKQILIVYIFILALLKIHIATNNILCSYDNLLWGIQSYQVRSQIVNNIIY